VVNIILDGKKLASEIKEELKEKVEELKREGVFPTLAIVLVGEDRSSRVYVRNKMKAGEEIGIRSLLYEKPEDIQEKELIDSVKKLNEDKSVHGIIVQLPLPKHIDGIKICKTISPNKDVDCVNPVNVGNLFWGKYSIAPATPKGVIKLIESTGIDVEGKHAVVIGRSIIVGKPISILLQQKNATVTMCHSKTKNIGEITRQADILIVAAGSPRMIKKDMVKEGAMVIDVGTTYVDGKIVGDVDFDQVKDVASYITPVPGGVGPLTVTMVLENVLILAQGEVK